mmetsp:Transcript_15450/g.40147  ORF Transcript_15450/g.40147 Transcript_15450/m.40147 type:complete len:224 (+) Transcript_15450:116-787(+)
MLYADKVALANRARLRMLEIRDRELELYTRNSRALGFQCAMLAGSGFAAFVYCKMTYYQDGGFWMQLLYPGAISLLVGSALLALHNFMLIAMLGPGLALRGPDGSVHIAIESIMVEYRTAIFFFGFAITSLHVMALVYAWSGVFMLGLKISLTASVLTSLYMVLSYARHVSSVFRIPVVNTGAFYPSQAVYTLEDDNTAQQARRSRQQTQSQQSSGRRSRQMH